MTELVQSEANEARHRLLVLLCTSMPSFMLQLDANIVSVSLPSIARALHASFEGIEWVISAYMLSFASLVLPCGALADRFGRKTILIVGLSVFTAASWLCGAAWSLPVLIAARSLQGAGAAMQLSAALATLSHSFQGEARTKAFAFWGSVVGIGIASGPVVGGLITQAFGWQWAFYVNIPIGIGLMLLIRKVIASSRDPHAERLDVPGVLSFGASLFLLTLALIEDNRRGWTDPAIRAEFVGAILFFVCFLFVERRQRRPMLDLGYFLNPTYLGANLAQLSFAAGMLTMLTYIPIFLQSGLGHSSGEAGIMMIPMVLPLFVVPRIISRHFAHRLSGRALLSAGLAIVGAGLLILALVVQQRDYHTLVLGMFVMGVGAGILNGETTKVGMTVIPKERSGMASGVSGTVRFTGLVVGIAALGVVNYTEVQRRVESAFPAIPSTEGRSLVQAITAGHFPDTISQSTQALELKAVSIQSFAAGYQSLLFAAAIYVGAAALGTWLLVRAADTPPAPAPAKPVRLIGRKSKTLTERNEI